MARNQQLFINVFKISAKHPKRPLTSTKRITVNYKMPVPKATVSAPEPGAILSKPSVVVSGFLNDYGIDVSIYNTHLEKTSKPLEPQISADLSYDCSVPLVIGSNDIKIAASNKKDRTVSKIAVIYRPIVELTIDDPKNGYIIKYSRIVINGCATPGSIVTIGKNISTISKKGEFRISHPIKPGVNNITVTATKLGYEANKQEFTLTWEESEDDYKKAVFRDQLMPKISTDGSEKEFTMKV